MIVYHHPSSVSPPSWIMGARDLAMSQCSNGGYYYGIGPIYLLGDAGADKIDIGNGWTAWVNGAIDTFALRRDLVGQPLVGVPDIDGRIWAAPIILSEDGGRAFPVKYGTGFKPVLSQDQRRLIDFAQEAKILIPRLIGAASAEREDLMPAVCGMAAAALAFANHVPEALFSELGIIDTALAVGVLTAMSSETGQADGPDPV